MFLNGCKCNTGEIISAVMCLVMVLPVQEECGHRGANMVKGYESGGGTEASVIWGGWQSWDCSGEQ